jgi:hypothetical protein
VLGGARLSEARLLAERAFSKPLPIRLFCSPVDAVFCPPKPNVDISEAFRSWPISPPKLLPSGGNSAVAPVGAWDAGVPKRNDACDAGMRDDDED